MTVLVSPVRGRTPGVSPDIPGPFSNGATPADKIGGGCFTSTLAVMGSWAEMVAEAAMEASHDARLTVLTDDQQIPAGGFDGMLLLGSRGSGKTMSGMHWLNERCWAEPGLRARVIAPTSGDGVASCVEGVDGLLELSGRRVTFNPSAPGGACVTYPNGSRVWIIGTPTPKDVDRLRALTNIECLVADTRILTDRGEIPIVDVTTSDRVWTRRGWRRVLWSGQTGVRSDLYRVETEAGRTLTGTSDHRVWTGTWTPMAFLKTGDILNVWSSTGRSTTSGQTEDTGIHRLARHSTSRCGRSTTAPRRRGSRSTTLTMTWTTTTSATSDSWSGQSIVGTTCESTPTRQNESKLSQTGCGVFGRPTRGQQRPALSAEMSSAIETSLPSGSGSAPCGATKSADARSVRGMSFETRSVSSAGLRFAPGGTRRPEPCQSHAVDRVLRSTPISGAEPVYDLTIEGEHEFYANGVLVHNCDFFEEAAANPQLDAAVVQAALSRRRGTPRWVAATTPRPVAQIRRWIKDPAVVKRKLRMEDNPGLPQVYRDYAEDLKTNNPRMYRQEILAEVVDDIEGALWTWADLERSVIDEAPELVKIAVGVDPAVGRGTTGIVVVGIGVDGAVCVLEDASLTDVSPATWASQVARVFEKWGAASVIVEDNQGGRLVTSNLQAAELTLPIKTVTASLSKKARAIPVAALWEADDQRAKMLPGMSKLQAQMLEWVPDESKDSPDRIDALGHATAYLRGKSHGVVEIQHGVPKVTSLAGFRQQRLGA